MATANDDDKERQSADAWLEEALSLPAPDAESRKSVEILVGGLDSSVEASSQREQKASSALAEIDNLLGSLDDPPLPIQQKEEPKEKEKEKPRNQYAQIPEHLSRASLIKPTGQEPEVFKAKMAFVRRTSTKEGMEKHKRENTSEIHDTAELDALMADLKDDPIAVSPADDALRDLDVDMAALEVEAEFDEKGYVDTVASSPSAKVIEIPNSVSLKL
eukprot:CAMPEP_0168594896 /NCGR_PEP_ID=MMETSP0420-20121227/9147_1 /TAXON_ID=498008 /ORGANISM="Pessonella sp." /LENGTH=216 /DNA_ID=CAMNT_0008631255 /DNA_START=394 /DNA_END=1040 /DNA_ORIENTATION=-